MKLVFHLLRSRQKKLVKWTKDEIQNIFPVQQSTVFKVVVVALEAQKA